MAGAGGPGTAAGTTGTAGPNATPGPGAGDPGETVVRWTARATTIPEIERELARIWAASRVVTVDGVEERRVAARTSVMNLVVVATQPEIAERAAATISRLTGRHPSRVLIISSRDPDGPSWLDARIEAHCVLPRADAPETCAEMIHLFAGGATGRHLEAIVAPLVVHDLPVTLWWPGEPPFGSEQAADLFAIADRLIVDGSSWSGDGLARLRQMADLLERPGLAITDFALARQSRWREAIASIFDLPTILPYLRYVRRIAVAYAGRDELGRPGTANIIRPVYHVAWFASRLGMRVRRPLAPPAGGTSLPEAAGRGGADGRGFDATLGGPRGEVEVTLRPVPSRLPSGSTVRIELTAERRGSELRADVTAEAETVNIRVRLDGAHLLTRSFLAPRRTEVDLLAEAIETGASDPVARDAIRFAALLAGT